MHEPHVDSAGFYVGIRRYDGVFQAFQMPVSCWWLEPLEFCKLRVYGSNLEYS
jgi:hypothetical protein